MTQRDVATQRGVAVITGAGSGIGRAVAVGLAGAGFTVVLAGRRRDALEQTAAQITDAGLGPDRVLVVPTDVTDETAVRDLFEATATAGRIDVLFNNAGISAAAVPFDELDLATWRQVVEVNLTGMFLCAREAFSRMRRQQPQGGRIINNGSISASVPRPQAAAYTVTKHGVSGLTKQIALDGRGLGVTCGQVDVGNAASAMTAAMGGGVLQADGATRPEPTMDVGAVVAAVTTMATLPPDAVISELTVMAPQMPFVGRG